LAIFALTKQSWIILQSWAKSHLAMACLSSRCATMDTKLLTTPSVHPSYGRSDFKDFLVRRDIGAFA